MALKVGLVGYGLAGKVFHAPLFPAAGLDLAAVASSDSAKVLADHPGVTVHPTPAALFADPAVDLVVLATPSPTHPALMLEALAAGKHVVSDKPFTPSAAEADRVIAAAVKAGRIATCFQNRRWDSDFLTLGTLIKSGELGEIKSYRAHFEFYKGEVGDRWQERPAPGVGIHYDLGAHLIDQALQLFGLPDWIEGDLVIQRAGGEIADGFHARMGKGDLRIDLFGNYYAPDHSTRYAVHGTRGSYMKRFMDIQEDQLRSGMTPLDEGYGIEPQDRWARVTTYDGSAASARFEPSLPGAHQQFYSLLREAIENGSPPPVLAEEARDTIRVIEAIRESSEAGRRVTFG
ncbi:Gfo/Idh/MocA family oxidoreductase [Pelagibius sp.]|uniref:Gfo/Idh/MocA family oxidoreductase n=1 Tax=Pelagibius sp. TaxID=1931238 RepID=UPI003BAE88E2